MSLLMSCSRASRRSSVTFLLRICRSVALLFTKCVGCLSGVAFACVLFVVSSRFQSYATDRVYRAEFPMIDYRLRQATISNRDIVKEFLLGGACWLNCRSVDSFVWASSLDRALDATKRLKDSSTNTTMTVNGLGRFVSPTAACVDVLPYILSIVSPVLPIIQSAQSSSGP